MSLPKRHHYLPKFYLDGWADADSKVWSYRRPYKDLDVRHVHTSGTGYEEYLYSMLARGNTPERELLEMNFFQPVDNDAAKSLRYLRQFKAKPSDPELRDAWTRFVMSMFHRSPRRTKFLRERMRSKDGETIADAGGAIR